MNKSLTFALSIVTLSVSLCIPAVSAQDARPNPVPKKESVQEGVADLKIGDPAPDFSLIGIDDKTHKLSDYADAKVLMIAFISNHCPDSHAAEGRMKKLIADMGGKSFRFLAINPNNPEGLSIDELGYTKYNDGFEDMKRYAKEAGFNFPYLYDGETQVVAKAYGCLATPHVFIFDAERKLRYKGQFDDSRFEDAATVKVANAREAVAALLEGRPVTDAVSKPHGCSTKWLSKKSLVAEKMEKWDRTPVDVELIDAVGVAALRKNGTKKFRLFNVWATWCGPCVVEFPELVKTARKFGLRDFELITISNDTPDEANLGKVKAFLEKRGAGMGPKVQASVKAEGRGTNSYVYSGSDLGELMKGLDPEWPGAIPHTVFVGPGGEILWRHNGEVDGEELRAKVLELMGAFYKP